MHSNTTQSQTDREIEQEHLQEQQDKKSNWMIMKTEITAAAGVSKNTFFSIFTAFLLI